MIHPFYCYIGISLSFVVSLWLFTTGQLNPNTYFYAPLAILIIYFTLFSVASDKQVYTKRTWKQAIPRAIGKYILWGLIIWGVYSLYNSHPLYRSFTEKTRIFFKHYLTFFLYAGLPYFLLIEKWRYSLENTLADPYTKINVLLRDVRKGKIRKAMHRLTWQRYRRVYLMALIRIHYIPIMLYQIYVGATQFTVFSHGHSPWSLLTVVTIVTVMVWFIDSNNGAMGYFWESWLTKTRFKDVDPNAIHWFVVLICYVPFIRYAEEFVPFPKTLPNSVELLSSPIFHNGIEITMLVALVLYVISGSALNFSTSNLCYKKIQTKGPYAVVRHPATTCKLLFFALAFFRFRIAYTWVGVLCYAAWFTIYICRALVEERFLKRFPEYQAYMKKTRYRFIPGVV